MQSLTDINVYLDFDGEKHECIEYERLENVVEQSKEMIYRVEKMLEDPSRLEDELKVIDSYLDAIQREIENTKVL